MTYKAMFIELKTHLHGLGATFHRLVENVPPMHPIVLGEDLNGRRRLCRMAGEADAPGVHPYQRGKVAPTKFAHDGIVDGTNSSVRRDVPQEHPIALGGGFKWQTWVTDGERDRCTGGTSLPAGKSCTEKIRT